MVPASIPPNEDTPSKLLEDLDRIWRSDMSSKAAVNEAVRKLAENPDFDLCSVASKAIHDGFDCFRAYHLISEILPVVSRNATSLFDLLFVLFESMRNDMLSGIQYEIIEKMVELNPQVVAELKALLLESDREFVVNYLNSIYSRTPDPGRFDELILLFESDGALKQKIALVALGNCTFDQMPFEKFERAIRRLDELMSSATADLMAAATVFLTRQIGMGQLATERVLKLALSNINEVQFQLSRYLLLNVQNIAGNPILESIITRLVKNGVQSWGTIENIDMILYQFFGDEEKENLAESVFTDLLLHIDREKITGDLGDLFQSTMTRLGDIPKFSMRMVTNFFVSGDLRLIKRATEIMSWNRLYKKLTHTFDHSIIANMSIKDLTIVMHRMLATVFEPEELCSLTFSVLDAHPGNSAVRQLVWDCILNYVAVDYPKTTIEFINSELQSANGANRPLNYMDQLLEGIKSREKLRSDLPELKELRFTEIGLFKFALAEHRAMEGAKGSATHRPTLMDLVTKVPLKYGKAWFSFLDGRYTEPSGFHQFEVSFEVPRTEVFDPVGSTLQRIQFRTSRMIDNETDH